MGSAQTPKEDCRSTYEPSPTGTLDAGCGSIELLLQVVQGAESLDDSIAEGAGSKNATIALALALGRSKVGPEERVVDMA